MSNPVEQRTEDRVKLTNNIRRLEKALWGIASYPLSSSNPEADTLQKYAVNALEGRDYWKGKNYLEPK